MTGFGEPALPFQAKLATDSVPLAASGEYDFGRPKNSLINRHHFIFHFTPLRKRRTSSWLPMNSNERHSSQSRKINRKSRPDRTSYHRSFSFRTPAPPSACGVPKKTCAEAMARPISNRAAGSRRRTSASNLLSMRTAFTPATSGRTCLWHARSRRASPLKSSPPRPAG